MPGKAPLHPCAPPSSCGGRVRDRAGGCVGLDEHPKFSIDCVAAGSGRPGWTLRGTAPGGNRLSGLTASSQLEDATWAPQCPRPLAPLVVPLSSHSASAAQQHSAATTCVSPGLAPSSRLAGGVCEGPCALDAHMPRGVLSLPCQAGTWAAHGFSMAVAKSLRMPGAWVTFTLTTTNTSRCPPVTGASACSRSGSPGCVREVWRAGALGQGPQRESSPGTCPRASEHAPWALAMVPWVSPCTPSTLGSAEAGSSVTARPGPDVAQPFSRWPSMKLAMSLACLTPTGQAL